MSRAGNIEAILREHLQPTHLELRDVSHKHAGHAGAAPGGETHYELVIASPKFAGISKIKAHQMIYALLGDEFKRGLHALAIDARE